MKSFLAFFVAMGSILTLVAVGCSIGPRQPDWPQNGCMWNGKIYPLGRIERTEFCSKCYCGKDRMRCCTYGMFVPPYDKEKCKVIFNRKGCHFDVVQKDDPSKYCELFPYVA